MWDDEAFYAGLRTLDQKRADPAPDDRLWEGDAVEWYFDTRRGENFRSTKWTNDGAVHCYWTGLKGTEIKPRFCLRPGYLNAIPKIGIEVGARKTSYGMEVEFKLPWKNFPNFSPKAGEVIAIDAEICYSDGKARVDRFFAYGSPLSVQQPASLAKVELVDRLERDDWKACGPVLMPIRCDTPWEQPTKAQSQGMISLPPNHSDLVGKIVFRLTDLEGKAIGDFEAQSQHNASRRPFRPSDRQLAHRHRPAGRIPRDGHRLRQVGPGTDANRPAARQHVDAARLLKRR